MRLSVVCSSTCTKLLLPSYSFALLDQQPKLNCDQNTPKSKTRNVEGCAKQLNGLRPLDSFSKLGSMQDIIAYTACLDAAARVGDADAAQRTAKLSNVLKSEGGAAVRA